jgi:hypothetical protein
MLVVLPTSAPVALVVLVVLVVLGVGAVLALLAVAAVLVSTAAVLLGTPGGGGAGAGGAGAGVAVGSSIQCSAGDSSGAGVGCSSVATALTMGGERGYVVRHDGRLAPLEAECDLRDVGWEPAVVVWCPVAKGQQLLMKVPPPGSPGQGGAYQH